MRKLMLHLAVFALFMVLCTPTNTTEMRCIVCAVARGEDPYAAEWIRYNFFLGFDAIQLYDNNVNVSSTLLDLSHQYGERLQVHRITGEGIQISAYNHCWRKYMADKAWVAFIDLDEFIVLRKHANIKELLQSTVPAGGALSLHRVQFGSNGHQHYKNQTVLSRFTRRKAEVDIYVKTIAYLPDIYRVQIHFVLLLNQKFGVDCHGSPIKAAVHKPTTEDIAVIFHYYTKSFDEFRLKKLKGRADYNIHSGRVGGGIPEEHIILHEFMRASNGSNVVEDTSALDFYQQHMKQARPLMH